jgi:hypothetical protein
MGETHTARGGEGKYCSILFGKGRGHWEDVEIGVRVILKWNL